MTGKVISVVPPTAVIAQAINHLLEVPRKKLMQMGSPNEAQPQSDDL